MISDGFNLKNSTIIIRSLDSEVFGKFSIEEVLLIKSINLINGICKCEVILPNTNKNKIGYRWLSYIKNRGFGFSWEEKTNELGYDRSEIKIKHLVNE